MKKLLLVLSAIFVSMMGWATRLNPYAYNLKTVNWDPVVQELIVSFTVNAHPNTNQHKKDGVATNETGIQIHLVDPNNPSEKYYVYPVPAQMILDHISEDNYNYQCTIPIIGKDIQTGTVIPSNKQLTWAVTVQGVNSTNKSKPAVVDEDISGSYRPYSCHGIAVQNCQDAPDFGSIYVTEASNGATGVWQWITNESKGRSLLKYNPRLDEKPVAYKKSSDFSLRNGSTLLEPHRVRISDDGRIFVSSYNKNVTASLKQIDVWEFKQNSNGTHTYTPIIYHNYTANGVYGDRVCGMDVKGEGSNLKLLLCFFDEYDGNYANSFQAYEYNIGSLASGASTNTGTRKWRYRPVGNTSDAAAGEVATPQGVIERARKDKWYFYSDGFTNISYGAKNKNDILFAVDYFQGSWFNANIVYFKNGATPPTGFQVAEDPTGNQNVENHHYGGAGMLPYLDGNTEYIISGRARYHGYETNPSVQKVNEENDGRIHMYQLESGKVSATARNNYSLNVPTRAIVNDMAMDHAHNLYAVSFTDGTNDVGSGRIVAIALPYNGTTVTVAPNVNTNKLQYTPVKANHLEYHPYYDDNTKNGNKYQFSFNAINKPTSTAEIRFYKQESDILTNYNNYSFCYSFPAEKYTQGTMSVIFDASIDDGNDKTLKDTDGNGYLNLPAGEYYWTICIDNRIAEEHVFLPERISQDMNSSKMANVRNQYEDEGYNLSDIAIYRPMKAGQYNTLCLPFTVDLNLLADNHPYKIGDVFSFSGINYTTSTNAGEDMLELLFEKTTTITTYQPYLFAPKEDITTIQSLGTSITFNEVVGLSDPQYQTEKHNFTDKEGENSINFWSVMYKVTGLYPEDGEVCLILVDKNRLAQVLNKGDMLGFRAFFSLKRLSAGTQVGIAERKPTPTSIIDLNGTQVDVEKFMREGRVYIRVGESLYSLSGERVE